MKRRHRLFVAHSTEYAELVAVLSRPEAGGALVLGVFGMGKTALLQAALAHVGVPRPTMWVHCSPTLAQEPCGALSPYLSTGAPTGSPAQVLREISDVLAAGPTHNGIPLVVVEDAEFMDDETSFILSTLVENSAIKLVATGHLPLEEESTLFSLAESGLLSVLVVQPLDTSDVTLLAEELAGGSFTAAAAHVISAMTGGNPAFVEAFVQSCRDQDLIVRDESAVRDRALLVLARPAPQPDDALIELVREVSRHLTPQHRTVLELLALAGPLPPSDISAVAGEHHRLTESGLLDTADGIVRIAAEIHAIVLRSIIAPGRSARLYARWQENAGEPRTPGQVLWALEVGAAVSAGQVRSAIDQANCALDFPLAWRLTDAAEADESDIASLLRARTLIGLGRPYSALAILLRVGEQSQSPAAVRQALDLVIMAVDQTGAADLGVIERVWSARRAADGNATAGAYAAEHRRTREVIDLWQAAQGTDRPHHLIAEAERILADPALSPDGRVITLITLADLQSIMGRTETALTVARRALAEVASDDRMTADYDLLVRFRIGWNLVFSGRYTEAEDFLKTSRGAPLRPGLHRAGVLSIIQVLLETMRGQTERARRSLDEAVAELRLRDTSQVLPLALALRSLVDGPSSPDRAAAGRFGRDGRPPRRLLARAAAAASAGEADGFPLLEREILAATSEICASGPAGRRARRRLAELAGAMEGSRAALLTRLAYVAAAAEPEAAEDLARDAQVAGDWGIAALALARAATLRFEAGDIRRGGSALRQLRVLLRVRDVTPTSYIARALAMVELTSREEEIVRLTREGKSNAEIARALTVSQRTVEGHLYRIFAKLGISDRAQLRADDPGIDTASRA